MKLKTGVAFLFCMVTVGAAAQSFTTLASFNGTNGALPQGQLVQGSDGNFYGTTTNGGAGTSCYEGCGTVFKLTPAGKLTTIHDFCNETCQDGFAPQGGLIQSANGNFYGTAGAGGNASNAGTVFEITSAGKLTTLYSFCSQPNCADGIFLFSGLVQGSDGNFYGTTAAGGANGVGLETCGSIILQAGLGCGTVFKLTARGELTTLYSFCSQLNCTDGYQPMSGLVQAADGNFYGTTYGGGSGSGLYCESGCGTIFKITPAGALTTIYNFCLQLGCTDGKSPSSNLIQASDGNFYGTNYLANTVFKITPGGELTTLYTFCALRGCPDGLGPAAALMQATDGNFYGTTEEGGTGGNNGSGTVFSITPGGALTTLYSFCSQPDCVDGASGFASLMQNTNGILYGPTPRGGSSNEGTIFSMSMGLSPFVQTQSSSGKVGATVTILGNNLTGATGVTFDGTSATITVGKASEIKAKIPTGAMTGTVKVTTPAGTLTSNVPFRVSPQFKAFTPNKGPVATQVQLSGVSLSQTTQITFDGVATNAFTVDSDSQLTATVPAGATTGKIAITTAGGTATSSAVFKVTE